jgi:hypothetical protein
LLAEYCHGAWIRALRSEIKETWSWISLSSPEGSVTCQSVPSCGPFKNLAEVKAVDRIGDSSREKPRTAKQRPAKELPVVDSLLTDYSQQDNGFRERYEVGGTDPRPSPMGRLVRSQELRNTRVVLLWGINCPNDSLVLIQESLRGSS